MRVPLEEKSGTQAYPTSQEPGMEDGRQDVAPVALTAPCASTEAAVLKQAMVEEVLARLGRGEMVRNYIKQE